MFSNDSIYTDLDSYNSGNRLFNLNDSHNIWSSDKLCPIDNTFFMKNRSVFNSNLQIADRANRNNRKPPGNRSETNLIVNYLPDGFYEKDLFDLFSKAGPISHYHVVKNKDNRSECYGFVDYEKAADAEKAIDMFHQYQIQNKKLKVQNAAEGLLIKEEEKYRAIKGFNNIGYNVEIRNAPIRWTVNDVKNIFGKYGEILKVYEHIVDETVNVDSNTELKPKVFNVVFRYQTIAQKVVKRKNNQIAEPMWPLELELTIIGQEFIDMPTDNTRGSRPRSAKMRFDQMSECSWDNKPEMKYENNYQKSYESTILNWADSLDMTRPGLPLTSNGRPILKHKDNLMHINGGVYDVGTGHENTDKWSTNMSADCHVSVFFDNKMRNSCNDIKAIWEPKEPLAADLLPQDIFTRTPLLPSRFRNDDKMKHKTNVWYKMENMQPTGSFKLRGMAYWCYKAKIDGVQLVVSSSGGNAGVAAAYACRLLKLKCTVVVPHSTPVSIIGELLKENAEVIQEGATWKEAHTKAESIVSSYPRISRLVHPFDNSLLWGGYESMVDEIVADMKGARLDMIVLAVGGGGLLNGIAQGITKNKLNKTTAILAMETEGTACFNQSITMNRIVSIIPDSVATSLGACTISQRSWELYRNKEFHLFSKVCSDAEAVDACCQFLNEQNCLVEPACGASLSALYNGTLDDMADCRNSDLNVVVIVCGGRCIDVHSLLEMQQVYSAIMPGHGAVFDAPGGYDSLAANYEVAERFGSALTLSHKDMYQQQGAPALDSAASDMFYGNRYDAAYNHMFPAITKQADCTSGSILLAKPASNVLQESKFGYQRCSNIMLSENTNHQGYGPGNGSSTPGNSSVGGGGLGNGPSVGTYHHHHHQSLVGNEHGYMSSDLMSSPVGSQHSDKENRMLHNDN